MPMDLQSVQQGASRWVIATPILADPPKKSVPRQAF